MLKARSSDSKVACVYAPPALPGHGVLDQFGANSIVGVGGYFDPVGQQHVVIVGTADGKVNELCWQGPNPADQRVLRQFGANSIVRVGGYYADSDKNQHAIVGTKDGRVHELYWPVS